METTHDLHIGDARRMSAVPDASAHLVVTSPPYPMIEMWDGLFEDLSPGVRDDLAAGRGLAAFERMHGALDEVWAECRRALVPGGILCLNVGDATRTVGGEFGLYPNHARIVAAMLRLGMTPLPDILWRKPTNAPNKFMGSGMLPAGAYVTYEHEYILIFRKGGRRVFSGAARERRSRSAYFWEERNAWFSDLWSDLPGTGQRLKPSGARERSAAFPFELPYRLINMYSLHGDTVLDPFLGTGTTMAAALASARSSVGYERSAEFQETALDSLQSAVRAGQARCAARLDAHRSFVAERASAEKEIKHTSRAYGFPVMTKQEVDLCFYRPASARREGQGRVVASYAGLS